MALIYSYLATWIAGGVLLASGLLLERPQPLLGQDAHEAPALPAPPRPWLSLLWLGLLTYGGLGLVFEAMGALSPELRPACAALGGLSLFGAGGLVLRRAR